MREIEEQEFLNLIKNNNINPYQIYNHDIDYPSYFSTEHYLKYKHDDVEKEQKLNIVFFDIEVFTNNSGEFPEPNLAKYPIISNTIYSTFEKTYESFYMLNQNINLFPYNKLEELEESFKKILIKDGYISEEENIKINIFQNEQELLKSCWNKIHKIDPTVLSGFNSDKFDLPYIYNRLLRLFGENKETVNKILSKLETLNVQNFDKSQIIQIPDYPLLDIRTLYVPRSEGGMNYGKTQPSYTLDWISDTELKLKKLDYKDEGISIDDFYLKNPIEFLLYNIIDVILTNKLNQKLQHIELHNMIRRMMKVSFSSSLRGSSILFDNYVFYELLKDGKNVRFGILDEKKQYISEDEISKLPTPKIPLVKKPNIFKIDEETFNKFTFTYPGAYVKEPPDGKKIFTPEDGIIADLDATSLYPSMILQHNIGFDTFYGRILDPNTYKFIDIIKNYLDNNIEIPKIIYTQIGEYCKKYSRRVNTQNMSETTQLSYYITCFLLKKILDSKRSFNEITNPKNQKDYILLKKYFLPLIDCIDEIIETSKEYNSFAYNYLLNNEYNSDYIYIVENINDTNIKIVKILSNTVNDYLKINNISLSLAGTLFLKHEIKIGLFSDFLIRMKKLRDNYKEKRDKFTPNSDNYKKYDRLQTTTKIIMNTTYGLFGLSSYRYSNKFLATSITVQGRLSLKLSQIIGEMVLSRI